MMDFNGKHVLVAGLGSSGLSVIRTLGDRGAVLTVHDIKQPKELHNSLAQFENKVECTQLLGAELEHAPANLDMVVVSPGIPLDKPWIQECRQKGVPVLGDIELFFRLLPEEVPVIGISGTNGKTTVTSLLGHMLNSAGYAAFVGGNIGTPALSFYLTPKSYATAVLELSSFQLDTTETMKLDVAILMNVSPDHIDRYGTFEAYRNSKARLFMNQSDDQMMVINGDDPEALEAAKQGRGQVYRFGRDEHVGKGAFYRDGVITLKDEGETLQFFTRRSSLVGDANIDNMMAVILAARALGLSHAEIDHALSTFQGLPHRMEVVGEKHKVTFINDSKATNPHAVQKALAGMGRPVILLAGGSDKGLEYTSLRQTVAKNVRLALLFGQCAPALERDLSGCCPITRCQDMQEAFALAVKTAEPGDVVLLSPACASFDQFENYRHRGDVFRGLVQQYLE